MKGPEDEPHTEQFVVGLDTLDPSEWDTFGGKGATLGRLIDAGFSVPSGFCVTTNAYDSLLTDGIRKRIRTLDNLNPTDRAELERQGEAIRSFFRTREVPAELRDEILAAVDEYDATSYAVRSSATAEDLPNASFAGQHETYLGVMHDEIIDRVLDCLASLFTDRAIIYRSRNGIAHTDVALAVVIQEMVETEAAGVLFTADPDSGNRTIASVDATFGLGDSVVTGAVEADNARVVKSTGETLSYAIGSKRTKLSMENDVTHRITLSDAERRARVLSDEQLAELVRVGVQIESHLGRPQDIEWALVDGEFIILQSRPITTLFPLPEPMPPDERLHVYLSVGHTQAMAEAMPPLAVDLWMTVVEEMLAEFDSTGGRGQWAAHAGGRVYEDITPLLQLPVIRSNVVTGLKSIVEDAATGLDELIERRGEAFEGRLSLSVLPSLGRDVVWITRALVPIIPRIVSSYVLSFVRAGTDMPRLRRWYRTWGEQAAAEVLEPDDAARQAEKVFEGIPFDTITLMREVYPRFVPLMAAMTADAALRRIFPNEQDTIDAAGRGSSDEVGTRMNLGLEKLETVAREYPAVEKALKNGRSLDELADVEGGNTFESELETFLAEFGHRTTGETDPSRARWRDDPAGVVQIVRGNLLAGSDDTYRARLRERQQAAEQAIDRLLTKAGRGIFGTLREPVVRRLLLVYRGYLPLRDEPKQGSAHLFAAWHEGLQHVGEHLVSEGHIDAADDVWYLRKDELFAVLESAGLGDIDVASRRRDHERFARLDAPALLTSEGEAVTAATSADLGDDVLTGTGVSTGVVEGTARVVLDPRETIIEPGEILVAPSCDPAWTPLFLHADGVVTDVGGRMTHGALVAREYGLPAVMSVVKATTRIETGQRIRVDGGQGTVELLD